MDAPRTNRSHTHMLSNLSNFSYNYPAPFMAMPPYPYHQFSHHHIMMNNLMIAHPSYYGPPPPYARPVGIQRPLPPQDPELYPKIVMLLAGTDTSAATLEWPMSCLLNNPHVLEQAKKEIDSHIGQERLIDEPDISKLPYLQSIISETLQLHPAAPLLIPHEATNDCTIAGYNVPRGTLVLVNAWAIHRDPQVWSDATSFKPERFEKKVEVNKLIPFGLGRRACPGAGMAQRIVGMTLELLIQRFEWKRVSEEEIYMTEGAGISIPKIVPLEAMCKARHPIINKL